MIILGIDPGSRVAGYGVVQVEGNEQELLTCGVMRFSSEDSHPKRLRDIYEQLSEVVEEHPPDEGAIEMPVYGKNPQSMLKLGRAQAAAMLVLLNRDIPVTEYTPKQVKKAVTGNGNAPKQQVAYMVRSILSIEKEDVLSQDTTDALAVSICHAHRDGSPESSQHSGWGDFLRKNPDRIG